MPSGSRLTFRQIIRFTAWNSEGSQPLLGGERSSGSNSVVCILSLLIWLSVSIAGAALGALNFYKCPVEPRIPIYLIVGGGVATLTILMNLFQICKDSNLMTAILILLYLFCFSWFITGCVWVYGVHQPDYENHLSDLYCDKTLYLFAFWLPNVVFIFLGSIIVLMCCGAIVTCCCKD